MFQGWVGGWVGEGWNIFVQICSLPKYPSFLEGDLTHVAFGYGGYIRLTVRPQHQVGRLFFFSSEIPNRFQQHRHDTHSQLLLIIARKLNVVSTCWILLSIYVSQSNLKYCTIPLKCVQIDNPVKIFGFCETIVWNFEEACWENQLIWDSMVALFCYYHKQNK